MKFGSSGSATEHGEVLVVILEGCQIVGVCPEMDQSIFRNFEVTSVRLHLGEGSMIISPI